MKIRDYWHGFLAWLGARTVDAEEIIHSAGLDAPGPYGRKRRRVAIALPIVVVILLAMAMSASAHAAPGAGAIQIPEASVIYRLKLQRAAQAEFGLRAPVARIAAQIHQESHWKPTAASAYAQGLAQFTPSTAQWIPSICPSLGAFDPWDADQSLRAAACYDAWLYRRNAGATECDRWAFALSDYNGGSLFRMREQRLAQSAGADATRWFGQVERYKARSDVAFAENRGYVTRILVYLEGAYIAAGWDGSKACP